MINLTELKKKAQRPWLSDSFLKCWLNGESIFPLEIPFRTPSGRSLGSDFAKVRDWIALLHSNSKAVKGAGYVLEYRTINHQQLGRQRLPGRILFESQEDWLAYIGQQKTFRRFDELVGSSRRLLPEVMPFIAWKPLKVLEFAESWPSLLKVCRYFQLNPRPGRYIRQLGIQGVDTKFIESHKGILSELLSFALEPEDYDESVTGLSENGFERRFGLRYDEPLIRFRLLDSEDPVTDISVPVSQFIDHTSDWNSFELTLVPPDNVKNHAGYRLFCKDFESQEVKTIDYAPQQAAIPFTVKSISPYAEHAFQLSFLIGEASSRDPLWWGLGSSFVFIEQPAPTSAAPTTHEHNNDGSSWSVREALFAAGAGVFGLISVVYFLRYTLVPCLWNLHIHRKRGYDQLL